MTPQQAWRHAHTLAWCQRRFIKRLWRLVVNKYSIHI